MFKHSVKVPRLYKVAAKIAKEVKEGIGSIKNLVYANQKKHPNIKAIYALVTTLFQKNNEMDNILQRCQLLIKEPRLDPWLTKILIVELLWGKKYLPGDSKPEKTVRAYEQIFKAHLSDISLSTESNYGRAEIKPRYVRVNTLHMELHEAVDGFRDENWKLYKFLDKTKYKDFLNKVGSLEVDEFLIDIHVPNLLIFPPKTQFYSHPAYKNGSIILQDKASCLPVHILNPSPDSVVLDMCAAPGMKTTQIAAIMNDRGTVYAVEKNPMRFETLNKIVESSGASCIKSLQRDVLTCQASDFPGLQYILVDPSCTGSGMTDRLNVEEKDSQERIQKLSGFQIKILRSALTKFPDVKRVVYSTCSIHPEENEDVVRQVLETNTMFKLVPAAQYVNNTWLNFGSSEFGDIGKYCLYAKPVEDLTNGFFVAVFERLEDGEVNTMFNAKVYNYKRHVQSQEQRKAKRQEINDGDGFDNAAILDQQNSHASANEIDNTTENKYIEGTTENQVNANVHLKSKRKKHKKNELNTNSDNILFVDDNIIANRKINKPHRRKENINICENEKTETIEDNLYGESFDVEADFRENIEDNKYTKNKKRNKHITDCDKKSEVTQGDIESINKSVNKKSPSEENRNDSVCLKKSKKSNRVMVNVDSCLEAVDNVKSVHQAEPLKEKKKRKKHSESLINQFTINTTSDETSERNVGNDNNLSGSRSTNNKSVNKKIPSKENINDSLCHKKRKKSNLVLVNVDSCLEAVDILEGVHQGEPLKEKKKKKKHSA